MNPTKCPFIVGEHVRFTPCERTLGVYQDVERFGICVGQVYNIKEIRDETYLYFDGGKGGWPWNEFSPVDTTFAALPDVRIVVYAPGATPVAETMPNRTKRPNMTVGRAAILGLMQTYSKPGYDSVTVLEIQKLAYFQQCAGEPLKFNFEAGAFGPYADELRHVLNKIEGHFIQGFADGQNKPGTEFKFVEGAADEAQAVLTEHADTLTRIAKVAKLIEGFETPFGMELLASVHWVATQEKAAAKTDVDAAIAGVHGWTERKKRTMHADHIRAAWQRLREQGWI